MFPRTASIRVRASSLSASRNEYTFTLYVSKDTRSHSTVVRLHMSSLEEIPSVGILHSISSVDGVGRLKINALERLILYGQSDDPKTLFSWTISLATTISSSVAPVGVASQNFVLLATIEQQIFMPGGLYLITLTGSTVEWFNIVSGAVGRGQVEVIVNPAPSPGTCEACKEGTGGATDVPCVKSGRALLDVFTVACRQWSDGDAPLTYSFGIKPYNAEPAWLAFQFEASVKDIILPRCVCVCVCVCV